jgi:HlyD family secretion protein
VKRKWKIIVPVVLLILVATGIFASIKMSQRGIVVVQTGKAVRQDLTSLVTASGEIKPKNYINIGANQMGPLTAIFVKEGDTVKKGQLLAQIQSIDANADVRAQKASLNSSLADSAASEAALKAQDDNIEALTADLARSQADLDQKLADYQRGEQLFQSNLLARQDFDAKKAAYNGAIAAVNGAQGRLSQAKAQHAQYAAQLSGTQKRVTQQEAMLAKYNVIYDKYNAYAPLNGVVTNLPVRVGETVVPGIQSSTASTIMTIADMSEITAEVRVDETDIVNVALGQAADVTIDAIPNRTFKGKVTEIGDTALVRSTGVAASQSQTSTQEAKDFKVVVVLDVPEDSIRPGLSATAKITTATRHDVLSIPIQALTIRQKGDLQRKPAGNKNKPAAPPTPAMLKQMKEEIQGVFVVRGEKAAFEPVKTGITGATDIEVLSGLKEGDQIVTGSYQVIRTLRNDAKIKVDNKAPGAGITHT